jgi:rhodanese-related sulfurtransferase
LHRSVAAGAAAAAVTGVLLLGSTGGEGTRMPQDTMLAAMENGAAPHILDVRTTKGYAAGHVPAAIHVPYHQLWRQHADLAAGKDDPKDDPIVVYCSHGPRAGLARLQLWRSATERSHTFRDRCRAGSATVCRCGSVVSLDRNFRLSETTIY